MDIIQFRWKEILVEQLIFTPNYNSGTECLVKNIFNRVKDYDD